MSHKYQQWLYDKAEEHRVKAGSCRLRDDMVNEMVHLKITEAYQAAAKKYSQHQFNE